MRRACPSISEKRYECLDAKPGLLDDGAQRPSSEWLVAMNRNAHSADWRPIVAHDVVAAANPVDLEAGPNQSGDDRTSRKARQPVRRHCQAAIVR
jgi:hypothetical protein